MGLVDRRGQVFLKRSCRYRAHNDFIIVILYNGRVPEKFYKYTVLTRSKNCISINDIIIKFEITDERKTRGNCRRSGPIAGGQSFSYYRTRQNGVALRSAQRPQGYPPSPVDNDVRSFTVNTTPVHGVKVTGAYRH